MCTYKCNMQAGVLVGDGATGWGHAAAAASAASERYSPAQLTGGVAGRRTRGGVMVTTAGQASLLPSLKIHNPGAGRNLAQIPVHMYSVRTYVRTYVPLGHVYTVYFVIEEKLNFTAILPMVLSLHGTYYVCTCVKHTWFSYVRSIMLCHNFLIGKGHTCAPRTTCVLGGYTAAS
jgi:hypothetical protein